MKQRGITVDDGLAVPAMSAAEGGESSNHVGAREDLADLPQ